MPAVVVVVVVALAGCTDAESDPGFDSLPSESPTATPSPDAPAEASPSPEAAVGVDPTVVPPVEEMTTAYVEAVVNAIESSSGELFARVLAEPVNPIGALPDGVFDGLEALFAGDRLQLKIEEAEALAGSEAARELTLPAAQYTGVRYEILQVSYAEPGCLIAVGRINRDGTSVEGGDERVLSILSLVRVPDGAGEGNPTPWMVTESLPNANAAGEPNSDAFALESMLQDLEPALANDCTGGEASRVP